MRIYVQYKMIPLQDLGHDTEATKCPMAKLNIYNSFKILILQTWQNCRERYPKRGESFKFGVRTLTQSCASSALTRQKTQKFHKSCSGMYSIDLMHMTSQKGAQARWGSNVALPRAPSPSMQPAGQPLHAIPPGWPGPARTDWEAERQCALPAQHVHAARQVLTPNVASLLWRRDVNA